jgi:hypothetical protein
LKLADAQEQGGLLAPLLLPKRELINSKRHTLVIVGAVNLELSDPGGFSMCVKLALVAAMNHMQQILQQLSYGHILLSAPVIVNDHRQT